jgi:hypothetical protein
LTHPLGASHLESDLGPATAVFCELSRLSEVSQGRVLPSKLPGTAQLQQQRHPLRRRWRLGERPPQQRRRGLRRPTADRVGGGIAQARCHPGISRRLDGHEMGADPAPGRAIAVQETGRGPVRSVPLATGEKGLHRVAHDRMQKRGGESAPRISS